MWLCCLNLSIKYVSQSNVSLTHRRGSPSECPHPVEQAQRPACDDSVQDDGTGDGEDLAADAEDLSFLFIFNGGRCHGVGEPGDRNEGSGAAPFRQTGIDPCSGEEHADEDQEQRGPAAACVGRELLHLTVVVDHLSEKADCPAQEKCLEHVEPYIVPGRFLFSFLHSLHTVSVVSCAALYP